MNGKVALSAIPVGGSAVTSRKLYRTAAAGATYLLLATLADNTTTTYTDNIADSALGAQAPTTNTTADPQLVAWIVAARQTVETYTHRAIPAQTWDLKLDSFVDSDYYDCGALWLPNPPVTSITSVTYLDGAGASQTWAATTGWLSDLPTGPWARRARIYPAYGVPWPATYRTPNAIAIRFVAGYTTVPEAIKAAMKLLIGHWYQNREAVIVGTIAQDLPMAVAALLWPFKAW